jgi:hypothetical protein
MDKAMNQLAANIGALSLAVGFSQWILDALLSYQDLCHSKYPFAKANGNG